MKSQGIMCESFLEQNTSPSLVPLRLSETDLFLLRRVQSEIAPENAKQFVVFRPGENIESLMERIVVAPDPIFDPIFSKWLKSGIESVQGTPGKTLIIREFAEHVVNSLREEGDFHSNQAFYSMAGMPRLASRGVMESPNQNFLRMGDFIRIGRGNCRHQAFAMRALMLATGHNVSLSRGTLKTGFMREDGSWVEGGKSEREHGHAWITLRVGADMYFLIDTATGIIRPRPVKDFREPVLIKGDVLTPEGYVPVRQFRYEALEEGFLPEGQALPRESYVRSLTDYVI